jgi:hypothetical protein
MCINLNTLKNRIWTAIARKWTDLIGNILICTTFRALIRSIIHKQQTKKKLNFGEKIVNKIHNKFWQVHCFSLVIYYGGESNGKLPLRTCPGCSVPEPYRSPDWVLVLPKLAQGLNTNNKNNILRIQWKYLAQSRITTWWVQGKKWSRHWTRTRCEGNFWVAQLLKACV